MTGRRVVNRGRVPEHEALRHAAALRRPGGWVVRSVGGGRYARVPDALVDGPPPFAPGSSVRFTYDDGSAGRGMFRAMLIDGLAQVWTDAGRPAVLPVERIFLPPAVEPSIGWTDGEGRVRTGYATGPDGEAVEPAISRDTLERYDIVDDPVAEMLAEPFAGPPGGKPKGLIVSDPVHFSVEPEEWPDVGEAPVAEAFVAAAAELPTDAHGFPWQAGDRAVAPPLGPGVVVAVEPAAVAFLADDPRDRAGNGPVYLAWPRPVVAPIVRLPATAVEPTPSPTEVFDAQPTTVAPVAPVEAAEVPAGGGVADVGGNPVEPAPAGVVGGGGGTGPGDAADAGVAPPTLIVPAAEPARDYSAFLAAKGQLLGDFGFEPVWLPDWLFPAQRSLVEWAVRKGRAGIYADCGLGKGPIQLVVGENVVRREGRPYLIVAPLAVTAQFVTEAAKFGIEAVRSSDGRFPAGSRIVLTNYERLHHFDPDDFAGASCDESGCIKGFKGRRRKMVTEFLRRLKYRLLCTATPAPNDFVELGTSSEALGDLGLMDMLSRFFRHDQNTNHPNRNWSPDSKWRFRGHSQHDFWQWVCSWARAVRKPSDLGFDDGPFVLPELVEREHVVPCSTPRDGFLFALPANGLKEQREERRLTLEQRCEAAAALVAGTGRPAVSWCHLNPEGRLLAKLIPGAVEVRGSDPEEKKEEAFAAFQRGEIRVLVTKPTIAASGLNWQHCAHQTFFPSNSFEQYYQAVRRSYRFGQANPVTIDIVTSEGEAGVLANLRRKAAQAEVMFARLVALMNDGRRLERPDLHTKPIEVPPWLQAA